MTVTEATASSRRPDHGLDWAVVDDEMHSSFNDQARALGASLYGRRMHELMADYWPTATPSGRDRCDARVRADLEPMPKIVLSTSLDRVDYNARVVQGDVGPELEELRRSRATSTWAVRSFCDALIGGSPRCGPLPNQSGRGALSRPPNRRRGPSPAS